MSPYETFFESDFPDRPDEAVPAGLAGVEVTFELLFSGSPVSALAEPGVQVGDVLVWQTETPEWHRFADVSVGMVGLDRRLPIERTVVHRQVPTLPGQMLTIAQMYFTIPDINLGAKIEEVRGLTERALAMTVALLDDRITDRRIGERVFRRGYPEQGIDLSRNVRPFDPHAESTYNTADAIVCLQSIDLEKDQLGGPLELYLRAMGSDMRTHRIRLPLTCQRRR